MSGARAPLELMSLVDAGFLYLERPNAPLTIATVAIADGPIRLTDLTPAIEARLPRLRRLGQRAVRAPLSLAYPAWSDAEGFQVRDHVSHWGVPSPGDEAGLREIVAQLIAQPLRLERPLWEMHVIDGLERDRSAIVLKVHHCMVEGIAGTRMLELLLDRSGRPRRGTTPSAQPASTSPRVGDWSQAVWMRQRRRAELLVQALRKAARAGRPRSSPVEAFRATLESAQKLVSDELPHLPWNEPVHSARRIGFLRFSLADVSRIRGGHASTVNDVVLTILAGGIHRYLKARGLETKVLEVMALIPVSLPAAEPRGASAGRFSAMRVRLPVRVADDAERLRGIRAVLDRLKAEAAWRGVSGLLRLLEELPPPVFEVLARRVSVGRVANLVAANVPGPSEPRYLCGKRIESIHPLIPITDNIGLGLAVYSYDGSLHVGINADAYLVPDLEKLGQGIEESFQQLLSST